MQAVQVRFLAVDEETSCTRSCTKREKTPTSLPSINLINANSAFPYFGNGEMDNKKPGLDSFG